MISYSDLKLMCLSLSLVRSSIMLNKYKSTVWEYAKYFPLNVFGRYKTLQNAELHFLPIVLPTNLNMTL